MRRNLKKARLGAGLTQQQLADGIVNTAHGYSFLLH